MYIVLRLYFSQLSLQSPTSQITTLCYVSLTYYFQSLTLGHVSPKFDSKFRILSARVSELENDRLGLYALITRSVTIHTTSLGFKGLTTDRIPERFMCTAQIQVYITVYIGD